MSKGLKKIGTQEKKKLKECLGCVTGVTESRRGDENRKRQTGGVEQSDGMKGEHATKQKQSNTTG